jgi:hypothetical protein
MTTFIFKFLVLFSYAFIVAYNFAGFEQWALLGMGAISYWVLDILAKVDRLEELAKTLKREEGK